MGPVTRPSSRRHDEMRRVSLEPGVLKHAEGSCLVKFGDTHVLCTASLEDQAPSFLRGSGRGWVTAEYGMLPRATTERTRREAAAGKQSGRTQEIQRLIGRSLRAVTALDLIGERQIIIDCDVLQADGGTRTAAITGAFVALSLAIRSLMSAGKLSDNPMLHAVAAVSVGIVGKQPLLDLCYTEDAGAEVDLNLVMNAAGEFIELQGTGEEATFSEAQLAELLALGKAGIRELLVAQQAALADS
jgi:ribonuclease PH